MTEFKDDRGETLAGTIVANCAICAQRFANGRCLNEKVTGMISSIQ